MRYIIIALNPEASWRPRIGFQLGQMDGSGAALLWIFRSGAGLPSEDWQRTLYSRPFYRKRAFARSGLDKATKWQGYDIRLAVVRRLTVSGNRARRKSRICRKKKGRVRKKKTIREKYQNCNCGDTTLRFSAFTIACMEHHAGYIFFGGLRKTFQIPPCQKYSGGGYTLSLIHI